MQSDSKGVDSSAMRSKQSRSESYTLFTLALVTVATSIGLFETLGSTWLPTAPWLKAWEPNQVGEFLGVLAQVLGFFLSVLVSGLFAVGQYLSDRLPATVAKPLLWSRTVILSIIGLFIVLALDLFLFYCSNYGYVPVIGAGIVVISGLLGAVVCIRSVIDSVRAMNVLTYVDELKDKVRNQSMANVGEARGTPKPKEPTTTQPEAGASGAEASRKSDQQARQRRRYLGWMSRGKSALNWVATRTGGLPAWKYISELQLRWRRAKAAKTEVRFLQTLTDVGETLRFAVLHGHADVASATLSTLVASTGAKPKNTGEIGRPLSTQHARLLQAHICEALDTAIEHRNAVLFDRLLQAVADMVPALNDELLDGFIRKFGELLRNRELLALPEFTSALLNTTALIAQYMWARNRPALLREAVMLLQLEWDDSVEHYTEYSGIILRHLAGLWLQTEPSWLFGANSGTLPEGSHPAEVIRARYHWLGAKIVTGGLSDLAEPWMKGYQFVLRSLRAIDEHTKAARIKELLRVSVHLYTLSLEEDFLPFETGLPATLESILIAHNPSQLSVVRGITVQLISNIPTVIASGREPVVYHLARLFCTSLEQAIKQRDEQLVIELWKACRRFGVGPSRTGARVAAVLEKVVSLAADPQGGFSLLVACLYKDLLSLLEHPETSVNGQDILVEKLEQLIGPGMGSESAMLLIDDCFAGSHSLAVRSRKYKLALMLISANRDPAIWRRAQKASRRVLLNAIERAEEPTLQQVSHFIRQLTYIVMTNRHSEEGYAALALSVEAATDACVHARLLASPWPIQISLHMLVADLGALCAALHPDQWPKALSSEVLKKVNRDILSTAIQARCICPAAGEPLASAGAKPYELFVAHL